MVRRSRSELEQSGEASVRRAFESLGIKVKRSAVHGEADLVVSLDGRDLVVQVKTGSVITAEWLRSNARPRRAPSGSARVVVGDVIPAPLKEQLREAGWGWLDLRGQ